MRRSVWLLSFCPFYRGRFTTAYSGESIQGETTSTFGAQAGGYYDEETGLILFGQRYYDSSTGTWLTRDPIAEAGGINLYSYVQGNPTNRVDPSGLYAAIIKNGNKITIILPIEYRGAITPALAKSLDNAIQSYWSGKFGKYTVQTKVTHGPFKGGIFGDRWNVININNGQGISEVNRLTGFYSNIYKIDENGNECGQTQLEETIAHEAGHLMGAADRYSTSYVGGRRQSTPEKDYEKNLMATLIGSVDSRNIEEILHSDSNLLWALRIGGNLVIDVKEIERMIGINGGGK